MSCLYVKEWAEFQHYKDRNPPWIKLNTNTFQNYEFSRLQDASKLLAVCIWTLASRSKEGKIPCDLEWVKKQCGLSDFIKITHLKELIDKGYLIDASNVLADCKQSAIPETETETETERKKKEAKASKEKPQKYPLDFESFWVEYPSYRRKDKPDALAKWRIALKNTDAEKIISAARDYSQSKEAIDGFAPYPAKWLKGERFNDEPTVKSDANQPLPDSKRAENLRYLRDTLQKPLDNQQEHWLKTYEGGSNA